MFVHVLSKPDIILESLLLTMNQHVSHILKKTMCAFSPFIVVILFIIVITERESHYVDLAGLKCRDLPVPTSQALGLNE